MKMPENKFEIWKDGSHPPDAQCEGSGPEGQCRYVKAHGEKYCPRCMGHLKGVRKKEAIRNYRLTKYKARVEEKADSAKIKSLREEVGILRMTLEEIVNRCEEPTDLVIHSGKISDLILKIDKVVTSCHRLEKSSGSLLDKNIIINLVTKIIEIITEEIDNEEVLESISSKILSEILSAQNNEDSSSF